MNRICNIFVDNKQIPLLTVYFFMKTVCNGLRISSGKSNDYPQYAVYGLLSKMFARTYVSIIFADQLRRQFKVLVYIETICF